MVLLNHLIIARYKYLRGRGVFMLPTLPVVRHDTGRAMTVDPPDRVREAPRRFTVNVAEARRDDAMLLVLLMPYAPFRCSRSIVTPRPIMKAM